MVKTVVVLNIFVEMFSESSKTAFISNINLLCDINVLTVTRHFFITDLVKTLAIFYKCQKKVLQKIGVSIN